MRDRFAKTFRFTTAPENRFADVVHAPAARASTDNRTEGRTLLPEELVLLRGS